MPTIACIVAIGVALIVVLGNLARSWIRRWQLTARFARAQWGESRAERLLEARGYSIIAAQAVGSYAVSVDDVEVEIPLRSDYLVERDGQRFVAEVKTGRLAPHIRTPATRRQLLEYRVAFDVDGVLLVDAEELRVHVVRFPLPHPERAERASHLGWLLLGAALVVAVVLARLG